MPNETPGERVVRECPHNDDDIGFACSACIDGALAAARGQIDVLLEETVRDLEAQDFALRILHDTLGRMKAVLGYEGPEDGDLLVGWAMQIKAMALRDLTGAEEETRKAAPHA